MHKVQAQLMEDLCNLASALVGRSRVRHEMFNINTRHKVIQPKVKVSTKTPNFTHSDYRIKIGQRKVAFRRSFSKACNMYATEVKRGVLFTLQDLPSKLHKFLDPDLKVNDWRRHLVLTGRSTMEIDDATDQSTREALRACIAGAKPNSSSLALQVICKLLEEPDLHYRGDTVNTNHHLSGNAAKLGMVKKAGPAVHQLFKVVTAKYRALHPKPREIHKKWSLAELEHVTASVLVKQLSGSNPAHAYDPNSRLAALWFLTILPKGRKGFNWRNMEDQTPFGAEKR
jgi:transcription termination factor NusB